MELFNPQIAVDNLGPLLGGLWLTIQLTVVVIIALNAILLGQLAFGS